VKITNNEAPECVIIYSPLLLHHYIQISSWSQTHYSLFPYWEIKFHILLRHQIRLQFYVNSKS